MGVNFPYIGNVPGHPYENTYCHECGELLLRRRGPRLVSVNMEEGFKCPSCGASIPLTGKIVKPSMGGNIRSWLLY